jgi:hypothetical protein
MEGRKRWVFLFVFNLTFFICAPLSTPPPLHTCFIKKQSWLNRARTFTPLFAIAPAATSAANNLNSSDHHHSSSSNNSEPAWYLQQKMNEQVSPAFRTEVMSIMAPPPPPSSSSSATSTNNNTGVVLGEGGQQAMMMDFNMTPPLAIPTVDVNQVVGDGKVDIPMFLKPLFLMLPPAAPGQHPDVKYMISGLIENTMLAQAQIQNQNMTQAGKAVYERERECVCI